MSDIVCADVTTKDVSFYQIGVYQVTSENKINSRRLLAVDRRGRQLLLGNKHELTVIPFESLVQNQTISSETFKNVAKDIDGKFVIKLGPEGSKIDYLSISHNGCGKRLVVSIYDTSCSSLFLHFFDLSQLYLDGPNATPYCKFRVSGVDSNGFTRAIDWHPEQHNNVLACAFSNGTFNLLRISEPNNNSGNISILVDYKTKKISAISWSPKGKQISLGFEDVSCGSFAQFKLALPDNDLGTTVPFEEGRNFLLPDKFRSMQVVKLYWISTFNFLTVCLSEGKAKALFVTVPSPKAPNVPIKVVDAENPTYSFGDNVEDLCFEYTGETFVFYSNLSNNLGFVQMTGETWNIVESTDDTCIIFIENPVLGFNYLRGDGKGFVISQKGEMKSEQNDYFFTYEENGILKIYLKVNNLKDNFLNIPNVELAIPPKWKGNANSVIQKPSLPAFNQASQGPPSQFSVQPQVQASFQPQVQASFQPQIKAPAQTQINSQPLSFQTLATPAKAQATVSKAAPFSTEPPTEVEKVIQPNYEIIAKAIIDEFQDVFNTNMKDLKKFVEDVRKCNLTEALKSVENNIILNFEIGKTAENLLSDLDSDGERTLESCLHNTLLANVAKELCKSNPDVDAAQKFNTKYFLHSNCLVEALKKKVATIEKRLKEANELIQSENNQNHCVDLANQSVKDIFQVTKQHEINISQFKEILKSLLAKQQKVAEEDISKSMGKLKIVPPAHHLNRNNVQQNKNLKEHLAKRSHVPITRCGLVSNLEPKNLKSIQASLDKTIQAQKLIIAQNSIPPIIQPNIPQSLKKNDAIPKPTVSSKNTPVESFSFILNPKANSAIIPSSSSAAATITLPLKNPPKLSPLLASTPIPKSDPSSSASPNQATATNQIPQSSSLLSAALSTPPKAPTQQTQFSVQNQPVKPTPAFGTAPTGLFGSSSTSEISTTVSPSFFGTSSTITANKTTNVSTLPTTSTSFFGTSSAFGTTNSIPSFFTPKTASTAQSSASLTSTAVTTTSSLPQAKAISFALNSGTNATAITPSFGSATTQSGNTTLISDSTTNNAGQANSGTLNSKHDPETVAKGVSKFASLSGASFFNNASSAATVFRTTNTTTSSTTANAACSFSFLDAANSNSQTAKPVIGTSSFSGQTTGNFFPQANQAPSMFGKPPETLDSIGSLNICKPSSPQNAITPNVNPFGSPLTASPSNGLQSNNKFNEFRQNLSQPQATNLSSNSFGSFLNSPTNSIGFGSIGFSNSGFGQKAGTMANPQVLPSVQFSNIANAPLFGSNIETLSFSSFAGDEPPPQPAPSAFASEAFSSRRK